MVENPLREIYAGSSFVFDDLLNSIQGELGKVAANRDLARQMAMQLDSQKELAAFKSDLDFTKQVNLLEEKTKQEQEIVDYKNENTPKVKPFTMKEELDFVADERNKYFKNAPKATAILGEPDVQMHYVPTEDGGIVPRFGIATENGLIKTSDLLRRYTNIERFLNLQDKANELLNANKINIDSIVADTGESNGVPYMGRGDLNAVLGMSAEELATDDTKYLIAKEITDQFSSGNVQFNTLEVVDTEKTRIGRIIEELPAIYTSIVELSIPKKRFWRGDKNQKIGDVITRLSNSNEPDDENILEKLMIIVNNYGGFGEGFTSKNPREMYLNPRPEMVERDPTKILVSEEEYHQLLMFPDRVLPGTHSNTKVEDIPDNVFNGFISFDTDATSSGN